MQPTLHATRQNPQGASRLVHAISAWSVKTRRAPSWHSRSARVNDLKTTAMRVMSAPPSPPALSPLPGTGFLRTSLTTSRALNRDQKQLQQLWTIYDNLLPPLGRRRESAYWSRSSTSTAADRYCVSIRSTKTFPLFLSAATIFFGIPRRDCHGYGIKKRRVVLR